MQIDHVTFSKTGGAGVVARLLHDAQALAGLDSKLVSVLTTNLREEFLTHPVLATTAVIDKYIAAETSVTTLTSLLRRHVSSLGASALRADSVLHLHWMGGVISDRQLLSEYGTRRIVWTMHDMAPFTGFCHHSNDCRGFESTCQNCPQANPIFRRQVSVSLGKRKTTMEQLESVTFVAPSRWIYERAKSSSALRNCDLRHIPNPISDIFFQGGPKKIHSSTTKTSNFEEIVGLFVAQDLSDPNKRIMEGIESFLMGASRSGALGNVLLVGKNGSHISKISPNVHDLGEVDHAMLANVFDRADVLISVSFGESFGLVIGEAGAMGVPSIVLRGSGSEELVNDNVDGLLATSFDHLSELVARFCANAALRRKLSSGSAKKWRIHTPKRISALYELLYAEK